MSMMTYQILKSEDFTKIQKSGYLENGTFFFLSNKKIDQLQMKGSFMTKNCFVAEVTFKIRSPFSRAEIQYIQYSFHFPSFLPSNVFLPFHSLPEALH